MLEIPMKTP